MSESALELKLKEFWQENITLKKEIEKLKAENNQLVYELDKSRDSHMKIITKLARQRDILKKALEFYADKNNWLRDKNGWRHDMIIKDLDDESLKDWEGRFSGKTARLALKKHRGGK